MMTEKTNKKKKKTTTMLSALESAHAKLVVAKDDDGADDDQQREQEAALEALLTAWRLRRLPRIADLIDRVSDVVTELRGGPIKGKTITERTELWLEIARQKNAADVGRLIKTPWPKTHGQASRLITALRAFPHDPRIAKAITHVIDEAAYKPFPAMAFYSSLLADVKELRDSRSIPILAAQIQRTSAYYWRQRVEVMESSVVASLEAWAAKDAASSLTTAEEKVLLALEALYAADRAVERAEAKGEQDFLNAIYESPDDDSLRAVFADWLTEHNDPRGEFITLQLARASGGWRSHSVARFGTESFEDSLPSVRRATTEASLRREALLLKRHVKEWLTGPLTRLTREHDRVFERGFLSRASLGALKWVDGMSVITPELADPSWSTVRSLKTARNERLIIEDIVTLPSFKGLRELRGLPEESVERLSRGLSAECGARFESLDFHIADIDRQAKRESGKDAEHIIARHAHVTFPNVKSLAFAAAKHAFEWLLTTPIGKRAERLTLVNSRYEITTLIALVMKHRLTSAKELCAARPDLRRPDHYSQWRFTVTRDEQGLFTKLLCEAEGLGTLPARDDLDSVLEQFGEQGQSALTSLTIKYHSSRSARGTYSDKDLQAFEQRLKTFTALKEINVPWQRGDGDG